MQTVFEIGNTAKSAKVKLAMSNKRDLHGRAITNFRTKNAAASKGDEGDDKSNSAASGQDDEAPPPPQKLEESSQDDIENVFGDNVVRPKAVKDAKVFLPKKKKKKKKTANNRADKDEQNFIGYRAKDHHTEAGYSLMNAFEAQASSAVLDLTGDDNASARAKKNLTKWDVRKKKYVKVQVRLLTQSSCTTC